MQSAWPQSRITRGLEIEADTQHRDDGGDEECLEVSCAVDVADEVDSEEWRA